MVIQSKCGINSAKNYYDFSKKHIIDSVNGSLERLKTDYLDLLLLHRPDPLMDPEEVAEAFNELQAAERYVTLVCRTTTQRKFSCLKNTSAKSLS